MRLNNKVGQAAFEFFINYVWVFLITAVVIALAIYSNAFNVSFYSLKQQCTIFDQIECLGSVWSSPNNINLSLKSVSSASEILIKNITIIRSGEHIPLFTFNSREGSCMNLSGADCPTQGEGTILSSGTKLLFTLINKSEIDGKNLKGKLIINYYFNGSDPNQDLRTTKGLITISRQK